VIRRLWRWLRSLFAPRRGDDHLPGRRLALTAGAGALLGLATTRSSFAEAASETPGETGAEKRSRWGMAIDLERCTACNSCQVACRQENNIPTYGPGEKYDHRRMDWMEMLWREPEGSETTPSLPSMLPFPCLHCDDAPCTKVCPVNATYVDSEGIVVQVWDRCIGCRYCQVACPYGRRLFNWEEPKFEGSLAQMLNPDVATRPAGVVEKCTFCQHRLVRAKESAKIEGRELADAELQRLPACAAACPTRAITFGDLNDTESQVSKLERSPRTFKLLEHLGTKPKVFYLERQRDEEER
jgi:molybdopterin-containing oxidoreductase family iron-sulfur binding subunit